MIIRYSESFIDEMTEQIIFIAQDKPQAAFKFKDDIDKLIHQILEFPQKHRKSIYFDHEDFRDLVYKGYTITFKLDRDQEVIIILSLTKHQSR